MKIVIADDEPSMLDRLKRSIEQLGDKYGKIEICGVAENGLRLVDIVESLPEVDLVISDVRMPIMDGLSALVYLKHIKPNLKMVMLSSESPATMRAASGDGEQAKADLTKKTQMLEKIAVRVRNRERAEGKINTILEGCEKLALDPHDMARQYGALGFVRKPASPDKLSQIMDGLNSSTFLKIEI